MSTKSPRATSGHSAIPEPPHVNPNRRFQLPRLRELPFQFRHQPRHLLLERLLILVALRRPDVTAGRQRVPVRPHLFHRRHAAETGNGLRDSRPLERPFSLREPGISAPSLRPSRNRISPLRRRKPPVPPRFFERNQSAHGICVLANNCPESCTMQST